MADTTPVRDPKTDALITPQNAVLALIDYQPEQYAGVLRSSTASCWRTSRCSGAWPRRSSCPSC